ncbi:MAG: choice-of-anchor tandem repeat GloVer-containing protein [Verrucomicrobiota bacterium]
MCPEAALTPGNDGNFYGTTTYGGDGFGSVQAGLGYGTVFQVTPKGALTTLVSFDGTNGLYPNGLTLGNDGKFYGTTGGGGVGFTSGSLGTYGTVFQVTPKGALTTLVSFNGTNGQEPGGTLILGNDGNFYGTTHFGGSDFYGPSENSGVDGYGTVFRLLLPPVVPPMLTLQFSAGCPQLNLSGTLGNNFVVEYSTNLDNPNWINLLSVTNLSVSPYSLIDPAGVGQPARFYRAVMQ